MRYLLLVVLATLLTGCASTATVMEPHLTTECTDELIRFRGTQGPGQGQHIVLVSGDDEYRSEEALPQLARILSLRHGFTCTVLFPINPEDGLITPDHQTNIPGLENLADADLMVIATRFRNLPDDQMKHIDDYVQSGKPIIGLRTATHAFRIPAESPWRHYSWNAGGDEVDPAWHGGFGRNILGETWVAHHGAHGSQSTRGITAPGQSKHPINRGIVADSIWGPTDVYTVRLPLPNAFQPVVLGAVLEGMDMNDEAVDGDLNAPMMPVAWTQVREVDQNNGRVFTTTMGAATDFIASGSRRMFVNATYWALGLEDQIPSSGTDVRIVGTFEPTDFGFGTYVKGRTPSDMAELGQN